MLTVQHLSILHNRDLRPLIQDLSFTLAGTERLAVIGEEGNGKSALLKAIVRPDQLGAWADVTGKIAYPGERIGYLEQEWKCLTNLLPVHTKSGTTIRWLISATRNSFLWLPTARLTTIS